MMTTLQILHWLAGLTILAESLNKLERAHPLAPGMTRRKRLVDALKLLAWMLLALGGGGAVAAPLLLGLGVQSGHLLLLRLEHPLLSETALLLGFAVLIIRTRIKEGGTMTPQQLARATGARIDRASEWLAPIVAAMAEFGINTPVRQAAFLAQIGHESGGLRYTLEIWGPTPAQVRYEGRKDLGNVLAGDGVRFKGRGLIQTTGRANYVSTGAALGVDLINQPELLAEPELAARSAAWYWKSRGLNALADTGDFRRITLRINGGTNGQAERVALYAKALEVLA